MKKADRITAPRESRVLVVDDEPDIRELLELTLIKMGIGVALAGSVGEAKARLQESRFDLCLTDMRLGSSWCATLPPSDSTSRWR